MKPRSLLSLPFFLCWFAGFAAVRAGAMDPSLGQFLYAKQQQIERFSDTITNKVPGVFWKFFDAARREDWETTSNLFLKINAASQRYTTATNDEAITPALATVLWPPISESYGACDQFQQWNNRWLHRFGSEVINSIPPGSIYLGGTDPGRFIISALCESQVTGKPFFTITQNQLADHTYPEYLQAMYGKEIAIPSAADIQKAFEEYVADATRRKELGQLKSGEQVRTVNGQVEVSGQLAVMSVNGLIARTLFDNNPRRDFYIEESFPIEWMYPYLTPHGLIFQLNRKALPRLADEDVAKDRQYWLKLTAELVGPWLTETTSVKEVCDFADKYGQNKQLTDYPGDKEFAANDQARKCYSKLRSSLAGLFAWRSLNSTDPEQRNRLNLAADLAFRQSYALCPSSPEAIFRYVGLLVARQRTDDAILLVTASLRLNPDATQLRDLLNQLKKRE